MYEGEALRNGINAFIVGNERDDFSFQNVRQRDNGSLQPSPEPDYVGTLMSGFRPPEL